MPATVPSQSAGTSDQPRPSVTLVLPAYNEAARIGSALDELFGYLRRGGPPREGGRSSTELGPVEVLIVDDGSTDETVALVEARPEARPEAQRTSGMPQLRVLRQPHGGKGAAVRAGMLIAEGDYVIFADADLATPPDQLPLLTEALGASDLALGSRVHPDGSDRRRSQPLHRRAVGLLFHSLAAAWVTGAVAATRSVASKASAAQPRTTSSPVSASAASSSTPRSSTSPGVAVTR